MYIFSLILDQKSIMIKEGMKEGLIPLETPS